MQYLTNTYVMQLQGLKFYINRLLWYNHRHKKSVANYHDLLHFSNIK